MNLLSSLKMETQNHHHTAIASNIIETWYFLAVASVRTYEPNKQNQESKGTPLPYPETSI